MYETIDGISCDGNGRMWEREAAEAAMNEGVEALTKRIAELEAALRECLPQAEFYVKMLAAQKGHYPECTCERCIGVQVKFTKFKRALEDK